MTLKRSRWVGAVLFLYAAIVQYNDPDALPWMAIYLAGAIVSGLSARRPVPSFVYLLVGGIALAWSLSLWPDVIREGEFTATEIERESFGLLLVTIWMGVLFWRDRR